MKSERAVLNGEGRQFNLNVHDRNRDFGFLPFATKSKSCWSLLNDEIYMSQPIGFVAKGAEDKVCK